MASDTCTCGHVVDEHDWATQTCDADGCLCAGFEDAGSNDEPEPTYADDEYRGRIPWSGR